MTGDEQKNVRAKLPKFNYYLRLKEVRSRIVVRALSEALSVGAGGTAEGRFLQIEPLENTLKAVTFDMTELKLWKPGMR